MNCLRMLWEDEAGFIISAELVLVATIVVIGMIVGLAILRNQVVQELCDVGLSIGSVSQSWALSGTSTSWKNVAWTDHCGYRDVIDFCQTPQVTGMEPSGILVHGLLPLTDWQGYSLDAGGGPVSGERPGP